MKNTGKKFLSDIKLYSDYLKWNNDKGRYENWEEACEDIIDGHRKKYSNVDIENYLSFALKHMKSMKAFASQRSLQFRGPQIERSNLRIYNCSVLHAVKNTVFQEVFHLALNGCGVGVSLLKPFVENLSAIEGRSDKTKTYVIEDSIEGWSNALGVLMSSYFKTDQPFPEYKYCKIRFDYSLIRPEGSYISGGFRAPGPNGLKVALEKIESMLDALTKDGPTKLRPIHVFDIICHSSDAVLSGGVRRSALNMLVDPNDPEMINAKVGSWRQENPQRARSNNSVLLLRGGVKREEFEHLVKLNDGDSDIGFAFANSWFDMFNPCFEISFTPVNTNEDLTSIKYEDLKDWTKKNKELFGVQLCNLSSINAEKVGSKEDFLDFCRAAAILGTLQAGYTDFPYLSKSSEEITRKEALLGVSVTGWMNNPKLFNPEWLQEGARMVIQTNEELAIILCINPAARATCVKPEGNLSVVAQTASGAHPEHAELFFRIMQLNKNSDTAKYLEEHMPFVLEESVWSANKTDYVVFVPIVNPKDGLFKKDMKGVKHLELIKLIQENWVLPGTVKERGISKNINHNVSNTVIIDDFDSIIDYIWQNKETFTAVSFISDFGDKDFNQAPFTSVMSPDEIYNAYGKGSLLVSGLIVDGLHAFENNLWEACDCLINKDQKIFGTRQEVWLKKDWLRRAKQFAKNFFRGDIKKLVYCLKDVHLFHKWESINRQMKDVNFSEILKSPQYKNVSEYGAMACSGGACEITKI